MKTKAQKVEELKQAEELLKGSKFLAFAEFSGVPAEEVRKLRRAAKETGAKILMIKKRLLAIALKNKGVEFDTKQFKASIGTVFAEDAEKGTSTIYKFFSGMGENKDEKAANVKKILGGYDLNKMELLDASKVIAIGQLPPRDILMAQFMGMLVAPLRTFMYMVNEIAKGKGAPAAEEKTEPQTEAAPEAPATPEEPKAEIPAETPTETATDSEANPEEAK